MKTIFDGGLNKQIAKLKDAINFITENGAQLGLAAADIKSAAANLQNMINDIDNLLAASAAAEQAAATQKANRSTGTAQFALLINRMKGSANWKPEYSKKFRSDRKKTSFDPITDKPVFSLKIVANTPQVHFVKSGVDGMNIMVKVGADTAFTLDQPALRSPAILKRQFAPGVTQLLSVQLQAFKNGKPIGQPSDVATIAYTA